MPAMITLYGSGLAFGPSRSEPDRRFSELYYGSFERRIPVDEVDEDKATAWFKNGVLTVALPKLAPAKENVKRIAISGK